MCIRVLSWNAENFMRLDNSSPDFETLIVKPSMASSFPRFWRHRYGSGTSQASSKEGHPSRWLWEWRLL
jgi:hypothetical protein